MKLTIKTAKLQEMVSKAVKGAGNNKLIPITQMMAVKLEKNVLTLVTTDATNYLYIREPKVEGEDFYTVVPVEIFSKLISKMTCENITLEEKDTSLQVTGNGKYSVPIQYEDSGEVVAYPDPLKETKFKAKEGAEIQGTTVAVILNSVKPALATTLENPCYTGYYVGERVVATDRSLANSLECEVFKKPRLVSPEVMNLLTVMDTEKIHVDFKDSIICFSSPNCVVYGRDLPGIEDFQIDDLVPYLTEMEFPSCCEVSKNALLQLLDRISLFVSSYDKGAVNLTFTKDGIQLSSMSSNGTELLSYVTSENFKDNFTCPLDIVQFIKQVKAQTSEVVKIYYGNESAIKMVDGKVIQVMALLTDEEEEQGEDGEEIPFT